MESRNGSQLQTYCSHCNHRRSVAIDVCPRCGLRPVHKPSPIALNKFISHAANTNAAVTICIYFMAADDFVLGLVQGLATYRPMTMILNFSASIFCLLLVSKASKNPLCTIAICVVGNLLIHVAATLADVSSMKEWIVFKCILIIAPLLCIIIVLRQKTARRNERATTGNHGN